MPSQPSQPSQLTQPSQPSLSFCPSVCPVLSVLASPQQLLQPLPLSRKGGFPPRTDRIVGAVQIFLFAGYFFGQDCLHACHSGGRGWEVGGTKTYKHLNNNEQQHFICPLKSLYMNTSSSFLSVSDKCRRAPVATLNFPSANIYMSFTDSLCVHISALYLKVPTEMRLENKKTV